MLPFEPESLARIQARFAAALEGVWREAAQGTDRAGVVDRYGRWGAYQRAGIAGGVWVEDTPENRAAITQVARGVLAEQCPKATVLEAQHEWEEN